MTRKLNDPFRWTTGATTMIGLRVVDAEPGIRIEVLTPAVGGEQVAFSIAVPFMPTVMHADCITIEEHKQLVNAGVEAAVTHERAEYQPALDTLHAEIAQLRQAREEAFEREESIKKQIEIMAEETVNQLAAHAEEVEQLKQRLAAAEMIVSAARDVDQSAVLFRGHTVMGSKLRVAIARAGTLPGAYVSMEQHKIEIKGAVTQATARFRDVIEMLARRLSELAAPNIDVSNELAAADEAFALVPDPVAS